MFYKNILFLLPIVLAISGCLNFSQDGDEESYEDDILLVTNAISLEAPLADAYQYPVQIGRVFRQGEIPNFPQAVVANTPLLTQANVMTRWPDGSVQHVILSFIIDTLPAKKKIPVSFQNQMSGNTAQYETKDNMLDPQRYDFDTIINLMDSRKTTVTASARNMMKLDLFQYWLQGSICTSIIIADHSQERKFDMGFDSNDHRSIRPIFLASYWPSLNKVKIRTIVEICNTLHLQDQSYSLEIFSGYDRPNLIYTKSLFTHTAMSRWTKTYWIGGDPATVGINHNLTYLKTTKFIPNFDTAKVVPESSIATYYTNWRNADRDLRGAGLWMKYMPGTGGRMDIGPYPDWQVAWLYTGDYRLAELCFGMADLAASWPMHFREGITGRFFDSEGQVDALGKSLSLYARPTIWLERLNYEYTATEDKIIPVLEGTITNDGWEPDLAHQPDPFTLMYACTGDYFYLEEMYFWASYSAASISPTDTDYYGRGPKYAGGLVTQPRGEAWAFRSRARTAWLAPDNSPEKKYFYRLVEDAIAIWEGKHNITDSDYSDPASHEYANWSWGNTIGLKMWPNEQLPTLHFWYSGSTRHTEGIAYLDTNIVYQAMSPWEVSFILFSLGHARELGFPTEKFLQYIGAWSVEILTSSDTLPYYHCVPRIPTLRVSDKNFVESWQEFTSGYIPEYDPKSDYESTLGDATHGYGILIIPGIAYTKDVKIPNANLAWEWIQNNSLKAACLNSNPKWVILPRAK